MQNADQTNVINIPDRSGLGAVFYAIKAQDSLPIIKLLFEKELLDLEFVNKVKEQINLDGL